MRKYRKFISIFSLSISFWCSGMVSTGNAASELADYFADNGFGNAVAIVQHPAGVHHDGVTYVAYQGPKEDPYVAAYNHSAGEWSGPVKAGISDMGKEPDRPKPIDNHGKPTMIIDDAGYIHVFFGGHGGMKKHGKNPLGNYHYGRNKHVVSKKPLDITEWEELNNIPPFGTYNQVVKMDNGDIYLFYRHGAHRSDWVYQKSTDNGRSFSQPVSFLKHKRRDDLAAVDSWYAWAGKGRENEIIFGYDYHLCWDGDAGIDWRGHTAQRHDVYYMAFDTQSEVWRNVEGEELEMPIIREYADKKTLAARTGHLWTFNGSVHLDNNGNPHIGINMGEDLGGDTGGPKRTSHFRWNGKEWVGGREGGMPVARGDFTVSSPENISFILGYKEDGFGIVARWNSTDGGASFARGKELLRRDKAGFVISSIIENAHPDAQVIVGETDGSTGFRKMYLLGDNGPVKRVRADADQ